MKIKTIILGIFTLFFFLNACVRSNSEKKNTDDSLKSGNTIEENLPLMPGISTKTTLYTVKANEDNEINTENGSKIKILKGTFVDENGKDITDIISLSYKEIRTASDIIINGIDMKYDSAEISYDFQTGGMFEVTAVCNKKPVFIKAGKSFEVSFVSNSRENFGFYSYSNNNWTYKGETKSEPLLENRTSKLNFELLKPTKSDPANDLIIDIKIPYKNIPELSIYKRILWKYAGSQTYSEVKELLKKQISMPELQQTNEIGKYTLKFTTGKIKNELLISPVFGAKDYTQAMNQYNTMTVANNGTVEYQRKTTVSELGLMNYDRIYHRPGAVPIFANFEIIDNGKSYDTQNLPIFHITGNDDVVVKQSNKQELYFSRQLKNKIIAILPDNRVAILNSNDFLESVKSAKTKSTVIFTLKISENQIKTSDDLDKIISML